MGNQEAIKSKEYLENLITIIRDGPAKFNASEPVMQHLNCLWSRLNNASLESEPEPQGHLVDSSLYHFATQKHKKEFDRLTAENNRFRDEDGFKDIVHNQTNKIIRLEAQLKAKDKALVIARSAIHRASIMYFSGTKDIDKMLAEQEDLIKKVLKGT